MTKISFFVSLVAQVEFVAERMKTLTEVLYSLRSSNKGRYMQKFKYMRNGNAATHTRKVMESQFFQKQN